MILLGLSTKDGEKLKNEMLIDGQGVNKPSLIEPYFLALGH